jgi:hypothetical protein
MHYHLTKQLRSQRQSSDFSHPGSKMVYYACGHLAAIAAKSYACISITCGSIRPTLAGLSATGSCFPRGMPAPYCIPPWPTGVSSRSKSC